MVLRCGDAYLGRNTRNFPKGPAMTTQNRPVEVVLLDHHAVDLHARQLRAQAVAAGFRALGAWIARRWSALRGTGSRLPA